MRLVTLFLIAAFAASTVDAASYLKIDGTIVDPIMEESPYSPHSYSGANLEPDADLSYAGLYYAGLYYAGLYYAGLYYAGLYYANLIDANLTGASSNVWARSDIFSFCFRQQRVSWLY
jgi:hypothetical protein